MKLEVTSVFREQLPEFATWYLNSEQLNKLRIQEYNNYRESYSRREYHSYCKLFASLRTPLYLRDEHMFIIPNFCYNLSASNPGGIIIIEGGSRDSRKVYTTYRSFLHDNYCLLQCEDCEQWFLEEELEFKVVHDGADDVEVALCHKCAKVRYEKEDKEIPNEDFCNGCKYYQFTNQCTLLALGYKCER